MYSSFGFQSSAWTFKQEVQFLPARVEGQSELYFILNILNVLRTIRCIDDARYEEVLYWHPEDNRPDKAGQYRRVKRAMEGEGITGPEFVEV